MKTQAYSDTPLAKKLGIKEGYKIKLVTQPHYYLSLFADFPNDIRIIENPTTKVNFIHFFPLNALDLINKILPLKNQLYDAGIMWVSWHKKSSKIISDVTEDIIRRIALQNGLVDIKVCSVDEFWSGLKLVIPIKYRKRKD